MRRSLFDCEMSWRGGFSSLGLPTNSIASGSVCYASGWGLNYAHKFEENVDENVKKVANLDKNESLNFLARF